MIKIHKHLLNLAPAQTHRNAGKRNGRKKQLQTCNGPRDRYSTTMAPTHIKRTCFAFYSSFFLSFYIKKFSSYFACLHRKDERIYNSGTALESDGLRAPPHDLIPFSQCLPLQSKRIHIPVRRLQRQRRRAKVKIVSGSHSNVRLAHDSRFHPPTLTFYTFYAWTTFVVSTVLSELIYFRRKDKII